MALGLRQRCRSVPAHRVAREQPRHRHRCPRPAREWRLFAIVCPSPPDCLGDLPRANLDVRDSRHAGQRLAAEPERPDSRQTVDSVQLAGCVPGEEQAGVGRRDPCAVVMDGDQIVSAGDNLDLYPRCPGIERVVDKLANSSARSGDHLAGRYAPDDHVRQDADCHQFACAASRRSSASSSARGPTCSRLAARRRC